MRRVHVKMIQFAIAFVVLAGVGIFGAVYMIGGLGDIRFRAMSQSADGE